MTTTNIKVIEMQGVRVLTTAQLADVLNVSTDKLLGLDPQA